MSRDIQEALPRALQSHDLAQRLDALQAIKNDVVGHPQKKEKWLEAGVLQPIGENLSLSSRSTIQGGQRASSSVEEKMRLQSLQLLSSFAKGGYAFLSPLHAVDALRGILSNISPNDKSPEVVVAALRATLDIVQATRLAPNTCGPELSTLADMVFVSPLLDAFRDILGGTVTSPLIQAQRNLVAKVVSLLCTEDRHQMHLADSGILDLLATNLASVIVARGYAIPGAEAAARNDGILDLFPPPAARSTDVTAIFEALSSIIGDSTWRSSALVHSPAMLVIFPHAGLTHRPTPMKACAAAFTSTGLGSRTSQELGVMDSFLPVLPEIPPVPSTSIPFPPLGSSHRKDGPSILWNTSSFTLEKSHEIGGAPESEIEESESPLVPWLIRTARSSGGMERVMAASVVTCLFRTGHANQSRESHMGRLIIPILLQGLEDMSGTWNNGAASLDGTETTTNRAIIERSLEVLAKLVVDRDFLQKCAFECSAVKTVGAYLKGAYEPISCKPLRPWSPTPQNQKPGPREAGALASRLGPCGQLPLLAHRIRLREAALKAVAALAGKDDIGKVIVEQDLVPYMVESLSATPSKPTKDGPRSPKIKLGRDDGAEVDPAYGANPVSVIVAACHALRTLSRSVSILRTTLQDCGVIIPVFRLLRHADIEIQIAASSLMCNLVTSVSPMRNQLDTDGLMRVLCSQTHSENPVLRLNALWALKHWIDGASLQAKKDCLEELTPGWLIQMIQEDTEDDALYQRRTRNEMQGAGVADEDVEMAQPGEASRTSIPALLQSSPSAPDAAARNARLQRAAEKTAEARETELNLVRKVRDDDLAVQEQGLNFLRNLIGPVDSVASVGEHSEIMEHLFTVLDRSRFFQILHDKLKPKFLHPFGRRHSSGQTDARVLYPQARIIVAVVFILVHMAAGIPRYRQMVTAQDKLLADLSRHFSSKHIEVRVSLCNLMANLTWPDDEDESQSRARAGELKRLGLLGKLETLESEDPEYQVRERAKAAIYQIKKPRGF